MKRINLIGKSLTNRCLNYIQESLLLQTADVKLTEIYISRSLLHTTNKKIFDAKLAEIQSFSSNIGSLKNGIKPIRIYFSHKHENAVIHGSKKKGVFDMSLDIYLLQIEKIVKELELFTENLYLVCKNSTFDFGWQTPTINVSNQIDLILFGSTDVAIRQFTKISAITDGYNKIRERYYASDNFVEFIIYGDN